jgi:hypothetical protein
MATERINRRRFSAGVAALASGAIALGRGALRAEPHGVVLMSAARFGDEDAGAMLDGEGLSSFPLPARGHGMTKLKDGLVLLVGRRPATFAAILDPALPGSATIVPPIAGHRFAGHAAVNGLGLIATSEIDAETGEGVAVLRDDNGRPRESFAVGIEPHDLFFAGDDRLVVAVGGIARAADIKGPAMNAGNIESAVVELDARSGRVIKRHVLGRSESSLSLRHMALAPDGETAAIGIQDQDRSVARPVMALLLLGRGLELLPLPEDRAAFRSYIGSVAIEKSGRYVAATSPKGGMIGVWRLSDGRWLEGYPLADVCGLAAADEPGTFWATSGYGDVVRLSVDESGLATLAHLRADAAFDNHLLRL